MKPEKSRFILKLFHSHIQKTVLFFATVFIISLSGHNVFACAPQKAEIEWIQQTLDVWDKTRKDSLLFTSTKLPWLILFDESCVLHINPDLSVFKPNSRSNLKIIFARKPYKIYSQKHEGKITLPTKEEIPAQLLSFASNYENGEKAFLVSAMPSIWQKAEHLKAEKNLNELVRGVFVHEMTHTFHRNYYARLDEFEKRLPDIENFDDDIIQNTFGKTDEFRKAYEIEHALLFQAIDTKDISTKRKFAKSAVEAIRARRKKFFSGKDSIYAEIEDIFLTMEGAGNWAAYKSAMAQGLSEPEAFKLIRRSGKSWSQDEGIALFVLIDSFLPKWQKKAFGKSVVSAVNLLDEALK